MPAGKSCRQLQWLRKLLWSRRSRIPQSRTAYGGLTILQLTDGMSLASYRKACGEGERLVQSRA